MPNVSSTLCCCAVMAPKGAVASKSTRPEFAFLKAVDKGLLEERAWCLETQEGAAVDVSDESTWEKGLAEDGN